jgi:hypothetical protein
MRPETFRPLTRECGLRETNKTEYLRVRMGCNIRHSPADSRIQTRRHESSLRPLRRSRCGSVETARLPMIDIFGPFHRICVWTEKLCSRTIAVAWFTWTRREHGAAHPEQLSAFIAVLQIMIKVSFYIFSEILFDHAGESFPR